MGPRHFSTTNELVCYSGRRRMAMHAGNNGAVAAVPDICTSHPRKKEPLAGFYSSHRSLRLFASDVDKL